ALVAARRIRRRARLASHLHTARHHHTRHRCRTTPPRRMDQTPRAFYIPSSQRHHLRLELFARTIARLGRYGCCTPSRQSNARPSVVCRLPSSLTRCNQCAHPSSLFYPHRLPTHETKEGGYYH